MDLKKKAISGVKWSALSTFARAGLEIVQLSLAARFLPTEALGVYAFVQIVLSFSHLFIDMGLGNALVHQQEAKPRHISELYTINLVFSIIVFVLVLVLAPAAAYFFEESQLTSLIWLVSVSFLFSGVGRVHLAILQKTLSFNLISRIELLSSVCGFVLAVSLLVNDFGVESLILGYLANTGIQNLLYWQCTSLKLHICWPHSWHELKAYLAFGAYKTTDSVVNFFNSSIDIILVGKLLGTEVLGGYHLARQICFKPAMIINPIVTKVSFPVMAKLQNSERLSKVYTQVSNILASINFPLYTAMAVLADPIVRVLFGEKWLHIVPIFQIMAIWCMFRSTMNPVGSLMMATGKVRLLLSWNLGLLFIFPLGIFIGTLWGGLGVVLALLSMQVALIPAHAYVLLYKANNLSFAGFFKAIVIPLAISVPTAGAVYSALSMWAPTNPILQIGLAGCLGLIIYAAMTWFFNPPIKTLFLDQLRSRKAI